MFRLEKENTYQPNCTNKDTCKEDLKRSYIYPGHPIAFSGIQNIVKYYHPYLNISDIEEILSEIENYTLHKEFHRPQRNVSYSHYPRYQFQCDLVDVQNLSKYNDGINYLLTCIDTFTRYAFVRLLKSKHAPLVLDAFQSILEEAIKPPKMVVLDRGTEFSNQLFKTFCQNNGIILYTPDTSIHGAYIERFNRTLQNIIYKYMTDAETRRFIDRQDKTTGQRELLMPLFVQTYNHRIHRMIGTTPYEAETNPNCHVEIRKKMTKYYETVKSKKPKFKIGDTVRIQKLKGKFDRGYNEQAIQETFKINEVKTNLKIPMYVLSDYSGNEIIKGRFYQNELVKVSGDIFRVEKVIKRRRYRGKNQLFVKWKGFNESYNSWIDADQVTRTF